MSVLIRCWGDYACFTRPEMKAERVSYDVMTPSAARGILDAVYWHDGIKWVVDRIWARKPVKFVSIRRNELKNVMNGKSVIKAIRENSFPDTCDTNEQRTQRASLVLRDVEYYIKAHFDIDESVYDGPEAKAYAVITQRLKKGACYHHPYFGCREFPASFEAAESVPACPNELKGERDLNWMLWDWDYGSDPGSQPVPLFFRPVMKDGCIDIPKRGDLP